MLLPLENANPNFWYRFICENNINYHSGLESFKYTKNIFFVFINKKRKLLIFSILKLNYQLINLHNPNYPNN